MADRETSNTIDSKTSVGVVQPSKAVLFAPPDELELECGRRLGPVEVAYETYGQLSPARDNAVLICHALSGDSHAAGYHDEAGQTPGWWEDMIGPGKAIDTNLYYVICSNVLGGCRGTTGPSSINPETNQPWGLSFPVITIEDMVKVQKGLVEHLGITQLLAVLGGSMGGMQVLEWAVSYPEAVKAAIPIATTPRLNAQSIAFDAVGRNAILADPNFNDGKYHDGSLPAAGLAIARMVGHITYLSEQGMHAKFGRQLRHAENYSYDFGSEFSVETYLDYKGRAFVERFDANSYLYITKAIDYYDLGARFGNLQKALADVRSRFLVISFSSDWLFPPAQSRQIVDALLANHKQVSYSEVASPYGHDAFLLEPDVLGRLISGFLASASGQPKLVGADVVEPYRQQPQINTAWTRQRMDYDQIEDLIPPGSSVLDVGCGRGALLSRLMHHKDAHGAGVEVAQEDICECIDRGIDVLDLDIDRELTSFADQSYDFVVCSHTLQTIARPDHVLQEILRIGCKCVVSFPNFAHWLPVFQMLLSRKTPVTENLPFSWFNTPNRHYLTLRDFESYCADNNIAIHDRIALRENTRRLVRVFPTWRAEEAIFVISRAN